jgi:glycerol-3-phosphate acyltransferase PlsY
VTVCVISGLLAWRHKENIARLIAGTESRIGAKKA